MAGNWYNTSWKMRRPVAVTALGGATGSGPVDVEINIPADWDDFWENVNSNMYDVVPVTADGTLIPFKRSAPPGTSPSYSDRRLTIECDALTVASQDAVSFIYIYWLNSGASDQATSPTIGSPKMGYIFLGMPAGRVVQVLPNRATSEAPQTSF